MNEAVRLPRRRRLHAVLLRLRRGSSVPGEKNKRRGGSSAAGASPDELEPGAARVARERDPDRGKHGARPADAGVDGAPPPCRLPCRRLEIYVGACSGALYSKRTAHPINSIKLSAKHVQLHQLQLQKKKVELRVRSTFLWSTSRRAPKH
jgi:hypothetical protein